MLRTYFTRQTPQTTYDAGPAGPSLDAFTHWLAQRGYRHETIRRRLQGAAHLVTWAHTTGCPLASLSPTTLEHFRYHLAQQGQFCASGGQDAVRWLGGQHFLAFLQGQQIIGPAQVSRETAHPALLEAFEQWMHMHRGVKPSTWLIYRPHVLAWLTALGTCPEPWDIAQARTGILADAHHRSPALVKKRVTAFRMLLRFLRATGRCQPGLEAAIPTIAMWRRATLPWY